MNHQTRIIALETSSGIGSVALAQGPKILCENQFTANMQHASELLPTIAKLCKNHNWRPSDIDQLYVSLGPGSFTGLRIAVTAAKALAFAQNVKIVGVPSCEVLALNGDCAAREEHIDIKYLAVVVDAGRKKIFTAVFERLAENSHFTGNFIPGFRTLIESTMIQPVALLKIAPRPLHLLGEGLNLYQRELSGEQIFLLPGQYYYPRVANVVRCGWLRAQQGKFADPEQLTPMYLRRPDAEEKWQQLHGKD